MCLFWSLFVYPRGTLTSWTDGPIRLCMAIKNEILNYVQDLGILDFFCDFLDEFLKLIFRIITLPCIFVQRTRKAILWCACSRRRLRNPQWWTQVIHLISLTSTCQKSTVMDTGNSPISLTITWDRAFWYPLTTPCTYNLFSVCFHFFVFQQNYTLKLNWTLKHWNWIGPVL